MTRGQTVIIAIVLIAVGALMLLSRYGLPFLQSVSWPLVLVVIGSAMMAAFYISKPKKIYLLNGSILVWLGIYFFVVENFLEAYYSYDQLWPGIIIAVGVGQSTASLMSSKLRYHIITGLMLIAGGSALFFFTYGGFEGLSYSNFIVLVSAVLILIGLKLILDFFIASREKA